jgi:sugar phosphate isomerase/epimerase
VGHLLESYNLELTALVCPLPHGLDTAEGQELHLEEVKKALNLSFDLGSRRTIVQPGRIPEDPDSPGAWLLTEALQTLGRYGDRTGTALALETGLESGQVMRQFLDRLDTGGLGVNFNPANLLLNGFDPLESARALRGKIIHTQANDGRSANASRSAQEVPLGQGDIDWAQYLGVLTEIEYRGWLTIECAAGENRLADVATGVQFLRRLVGPGSVYA